MEDLALFFILELLKVQQEVNIQNNKLESSMPINTE